MLKAGGIFTRNVKVRETDLNRSVLYECVSDWQGDRHYFCISLPNCG
jgi:hypothetical protein